MRVHAFHRGADNGDRTRMLRLSRSRARPAHVPRRAPPPASTASAWRGPMFCNSIRPCSHCSVTATRWLLNDSAALEVY